MDVTTIAIGVLCFVAVSKIIRALVKFARRATSEGYIAPLKKVHSHPNDFYEYVSKPTVQDLVNPIRFAINQGRRDYNRREWRLAYRTIRDYARHDHPACKRALISLRGYV